MEDDVLERLAANPQSILELAVPVARTGVLPPRVYIDTARAGASRLSPGAEARRAIELGLLEPRADVALDWLDKSGALAQLLPEVAATVSFSQEAGRRHKDVWEHTKLVVAQSPARPDVRWAALIHDIGKVGTRTVSPDGEVHFHGHAELGARRFDGIARRFGFDRDQAKRIRFLVYNHLRASGYLPSWTASAVRRFDHEMGDHIVDLLDLSRADITSRRPGRRESLLQQIDELWRRVEEIRALDAVVPPLPTGLGTAIGERFGIPPSRKIGDLKRALEAACEAGELEERQGDEYYLAWLEKSGLVETPKP